MGSHGFYAISVGVNLHYGYAAMIVLAVVIAFSFKITKDIHSHADRNSYYLLQTIALLGAIAGAKIAVLMGDALWPLEPFHNWWELIWSGRSIVGALLFGFVAAELAKPLMNYTLPPNDRFAIILPVSIGVGRVGCYLVGCCQGILYDGPFAVVDNEGVSRHPAPIYELVFHIIMAYFLWRFYRSQKFKGQLFALFIVFYGFFRFVSEFVRDTEKAFFGYSAYQWFAIALIMVGIVSLWLRRSPRSTFVIREEVLS